MMSHSQLFMKKILFNGNLRVKFANNKKKMNISKANMVIRQIHTNTKPPQNKGPDLIFMILLAVTGYSVVKFNNKKAN